MSESSFVTKKFDFLSKRLKTLEKNGKNVVNLTKKKKKFG